MPSKLTHSIKQLTQETIEAPDKIKCLPQKIFLCGGVIADKGKYKSARDHTYRHIKENKPDLFQKIILAEEVTDWFHIDNIYRDLLELEKDLAGLVAAIPLFLEGPGAIAELGAFTQLPAIQEKLLVILTQDHYNHKSFIRLGPIRYTENYFGKQKRILRFVWKNKKNGSFDPDSFSPHVEKIAKRIEKSLEEASKDRKFDWAINAHRILLACDLINLFHVCTINELRQAIKYMGFQVSKKDLKNYLKMAENLSLVSHVDDGGDADTLYFIPDTLNQQDFVSYSFHSSTSDDKKDKTRWKTKFKKILDASERKSKIAHWRTSNGGEA